MFHNLMPISQLARVLITLNGENFPVQFFVWCMATMLKSGYSVTMVWQTVVEQATNKKTES